MIEGFDDNFFKDYIFNKIMKTLVYKRNTKNKETFGRVIANVDEKLCLNWKNKNKTLDLLIISNKCKNYKVNYENI